jgi:epidermal growth factor receptor substrate 15
MATSLFPNLTLQNAYNNVVTTDTLSGSVSNSVDQTSHTSNFVKSNNIEFINSSGTANFSSGAVNLSSSTVNFQTSTVNNFPTSQLGTLANTIAQTGTNTAHFGSTTWNASSVINATGATPENFTLTGANGNSVDNAALPATLTQNVSNNNTTTTTLQTGTAGTGGLTTVVSKNYSTTTSNTSGTICTISGLNNVVNNQWKADITISGSTSGTATGSAASAKYTVFKAGPVSAWLVYTQQSWSSNPTYIGIPTITTNPTSGTITVGQPSSTTSDGTANYNVECSFVALNSASITSPTLS